jgi:anti-sigma B factor antagonist
VGTADDHDRVPDDEPEFRCDVVPTPGMVTVCVAGDVDMATAPDVREALQRAGASEGDIVVDLGRCTFLDSSGLAVIVEANRQTRAAGHRFALRAPGRRVVQLLEVTSLRDEIEVEP